MYSKIFEAALGARMPRSASGRTTKTGVPVYSADERAANEKKRAAQVNKSILLDIVDGLRMGRYDERSAMERLTDVEGLDEPTARNVLKKAQDKIAR